MNAHSFPSQDEDHPSSCETDSGVEEGSEFHKLRTELLQFADDYDWVLKVNVAMAVSRGRSFKYVILHPDNLRDMAMALGQDPALDKNILTVLNTMHTQMLKMALGNAILTADDNKLRMLASLLVEQGHFSINDLKDERADLFDDQYIQILRFRMLEIMTSLNLAANFFELNVLRVATEDTREILPQKR